MKWMIVSAVIAGSAQAQDLGPVPVFAQIDPAVAALGQLLFYDPILSGNRNISCGSCHHPQLGTSDGVSLSIGDGGIGLGRERRIDQDNPPSQRIPRNSLALWNLGASEFVTFFYDGRLEVDSRMPGGIRTPLDSDMDADMLSRLDSVFAAQAMFPIVSADEMAGHYSENEVSKAVQKGQLNASGGAWELIANRVASIREYRTAFDTILGKDAPIGIIDIANAIAAFTTMEWRADDSPFDRAMAGETPLPVAAARGQDLFYGKAGCSTCHAGWLQTDHDFHAIAMPQIGPGKAAPFETHARDEGRMRVTGNTADQYRFRTPSLRNVALSAPYGHSGAYGTLEAVIRHHLDPVGALYAYTLDQAVLHELDGVFDGRVLHDTGEMARIAAANQLMPVRLGDADVDDLVAFLHSLTDERAAAGRLGVPQKVPSGLPVDH